MTRQKRLREMMAELGADGMLISSKVNQYYISGADFDDGYVLLTESHCYAVVDFRYIEAVKNSVNDGVTAVMAEGKGTLECAMELLCHGGTRSVLVEDSMSLACFKKAEGFGVELVPSAGVLLSKMRRTKTKSELELIAKAQEITDMAYSHILKVMTPSMTELDIALELEFFMRKNGAQGKAFEVITISGDASSLPHGRPRNIKLKKGFLTMDFGARFGGYCSDMTRTVVIGKADSEMVRLYSTVLSAQKAALEQIRAGADLRETDRTARDIIDKNGYKGLFGHSLGHGVGMYIHELPNMSPRAEGRLEEGDVVTVEPGIYIEGKYGCRIEDMVAVTENGCYNFTRSDKELTELF